MAWTCFLVGFVLNELPWVGIYYLVAATGLIVAQGEMHSPGAWASFGIALAALGGLGLASVRGARTGATVERALEDALGPGWEQRAAASAGGARRPGFSVGAASFLPLPARRRDVVRVADQSYGDAGRSNLLDVYHHRSRPSGCPVLVHLHGGAMRSGRKNREGRPLIYDLASRGWVCISPNYRLAPQASFPDQLVDVKRVIAWARTHAARYGGNGDVVVLAGGSSGAQLAALAALTANDPRYQPGFEQADTAVAAAVALYGLYGWRSIRDDDGSGREAEDAPMAHLRADAPAFFVAHGDLDTLLRVEGARAFVAELRAVSRNAVVYAELAGAHHAFDRFRSVRCDNVVRGIERFCAWALAGGGGVDVSDRGGGGRL